MAEPSITPAPDELAVAYARLAVLLSGDDPSVKAINALAAAIAREVTPRLEEVGISPRLAADALVVAVGVVGNLGVLRANEQARGTLNILGAVAYTLYGASTTPPDPGATS